MITREELMGRMQQLQAAVRAQGVDLFLVSAESSIYYLTGVVYVPMERPFFILVRPEGQALLLVPALEQEHLSAAPNVGDVRHYWDYPSPSGEGWPDRLREMLDGVRTLGVEPSLPQEVAVALHDLAPRTLPLVETLRLRKSPAEVQMLRRAASYADMGMAKVLAASYHGVSELELFSLGRSVQLDIVKSTAFDALTTSTLTASWPAPASAMPHGVPSPGDRLLDGPHIALSLMRVNGYAAECERTYFLAPPTAQMKEMFAVMRAARERAFALLRPGVPCATIDEAANGFLRDEGLGGYLLHRTGHGFGLGGHEGPWLAAGSSDVLEPNMLVSVEPGIYLPGVGGFRHSDTLLITGDGFEKLTRAPETLDELVILARRPLLRLKGAVMRRMMRV
ncbi:MAG TPA: Xaa-Pro peptidase family protein [Anaerolineae bacterium]|nr:Xaa-Pro peptidase family protein [Anaerolineae bacterium]